jgi:transcriptional regulator with XRE-family HTH domain
LKEFGIYFAKLREESGYSSQRELADKSGVSHSTINRLEAGTHKASPEKLKILAKYLKGVTPNDLLEKFGYTDADPNSSRAYFDGGKGWTQEEIELADAFIKTLRENKSR